MNDDADSEGGTCDEWVRSSIWSGMCMRSAEEREREEEKIEGCTGCFVWWRWKKFSVVFLGMYLIWIVSWLFWMKEIFIFSILFNSKKFYLFRWERCTMHNMQIATVDISLSLAPYSPPPYPCVCARTVTGSRHCLLFSHNIILSSYNNFSELTTDR